MDFLGFGLERVGSDWNRMKSKGGKYLVKNDEKWHRNLFGKCQNSNANC